MFLRFPAGAFPCLPGCSLPALAPLPFVLALASPPFLPPPPAAVSIARRRASAPFPRSPHQHLASRESPPRLSRLYCPALAYPYPRSPPLPSPPLCPGFPLPPLPLVSCPSTHAHPCWRPSLPHLPSYSSLACSVYHTAFCVSPVRRAPTSLLVRVLELKDPIPFQCPVRTPGGKE